MDKKETGKKILQGFGGLLAPMAALFLLYALGYVFERAGLLWFSAAAVLLSVVMMLACMLVSIVMLVRRSAWRWFFIGMLVTGAAYALYAGGVLLVTQVLFPV